MKTGKKIIRIAALMLVCVMLLTVTPIQIFAANNDGNTAVAVQADSSAEKANVQ